jgi:hypothetical protein
MKPSPNERRGCKIVRDFLVGLAVFLTVFTLAMLDSRASRSAPAIVSTPAMAQTANGATPAAIKMVALEHSLVRRMTHIEVPGVTRSRPGNQPLASEELPDNHPAGLVSGARGVEPFTSGPDAGGNSVVTSSQNSKLALISGKTGAGGHMVPGASGGRERTWIFIVMALIFSAMTALTACLWRHLRLSVVPRRTGRRV